MATVKRSVMELLVQDALEQVFANDLLSAFNEDDAMYLRNVVSGYLRLTAYRGRSPLVQVSRLRRLVIAFLPDTVSAPATAPTATAPAATATAATAPTATAPTAETSAGSSKPTSLRSTRRRRRRLSRSCARLHPAQFQTPCGKRHSN